MPAMRLLLTYQPEYSPVETSSPWLTSSFQLQGHLACFGCALEPKQNGIICRDSTKCELLVPAWKNIGYLFDLFETRIGHVLGKVWTLENVVFA